MRERVEKVGFKPEKDAAEAESHKKYFTVDNIAFESRKIKGNDEEKRGDYFWPTTGSS